MKVEVIKRLKSIHPPPPSKKHFDNFLNSFTFEIRKLMIHPSLLLEKTNFLLEKKLDLASLENSYFFISFTSIHPILQSKKCMMVSFPHFNSCFLKARIRFIYFLNRSPSFSVQFIGRFVGLCPLLSLLRKM